uniref:Uncharacterized protein n=1 Tax=viral metagenome TaxID=1070528 RepID=A0A6C0AFR5_9ZZZZ
MNYRRNQENGAFRFVIDLKWTISNLQKNISL